MTSSRVLLAAWIILYAAGSTPAADRWPEWRGANGQGHADAVDLPLHWSEIKNIAWKTPIPGRGWSTPVVGKGQVWLTTAIDQPASAADAERRRKTSTNSQPLTVSDFVSLRAVGVDLRTGKLLHDIEMLSEQQPQMIHVDNSYATPSPILEDGRLYCHYGPSGFGCLDVESGRVLWANRSLRVRHENGPGSSPVLWEDLLIVHCDGIDQQYIVALDKRTGKQVWKTPRSGKLHADPQLRKSYATSLVAQVNGRPQVISPAADWVYGYEPSSGGELWRLSYGSLGFSNSARPLVGNGMIFTITGYLKSQMLAIRVDEEGGQARPRVLWRYAKQVPSVASPLLIGDEIYFVSDRGIASCIDARTGRAHWAVRVGKQFWASPLYADGRIHFFDRDGTTTVVAPGTSFDRLAVNKLDGQLMASGAAVDGALLLRTDRALYCIRR